MKKFKFTINGNQYDAEILSVEENFAEIEINGTHYKVEVDKGDAVMEGDVLIVIGE
jgi:biotin carboxyl carrier protein